MLEIRKLNVTFAPRTPNEHVTLRELDLSVPDGQFVTLLGSNGAGKSTLFNAICGTVLPDSGEILLDGQDVTYQPEFRRARVIGRVFQDPLRGTAPGMTIEENMALAYSRAHRGGLSRAIRRQDRAFFRESLARFGMGLEDRMKTKVGQLSGGQRQVVTMLMCTLVMPKLLLLDEHTAALDPVTAAHIMAVTETIVRENHLTTLMITHNMKSALVTGDRTILLDGGGIVVDLAGEERARMSLDDLLKLYSERTRRDMDNDRMLLG